MCGDVVYDNEWGFSNRMADTAVAMGKPISTPITKLYLPARIRTASAVSMTDASCKRVLLRVDLNLMHNGWVADASARNTATITEPRRPRRRRPYFALRPAEGRDPNESLAPVAKAVGRFKRLIAFADCVGASVRGVSFSRHPLSGKHPFPRRTIRTRCTTRCFPAMSICR